jgi:hypothetical protein
MILVINALTYLVPLIFFFWFILDNGMSTSYAQEQQPSEKQQSLVPEKSGVKITYPIDGQTAPKGELVIFGTATHNATTTDCTVYVDWNDQKPYEKAVATGPGGIDDYSNWTFTYTDKYHLITNGTNNLTSKLSCIDHDNNVNLTKWYSVNLMGISSDQNQQQPLQIIDNSTTLGDSATTAVIAGGGENEGISNVLPSYSDSKDCKDSKDIKDCKDSKDSKDSSKGKKTTKKKK